MANFRNIQRKPQASLPFALPRPCFAFSPPKQARPPGAAPPSGSSAGSFGYFLSAELSACDIAMLAALADRRPVIASLSRQHLGRRAGGRRSPRFVRKAIPQAGPQAILLAASSAFFRQLSLASRLFLVARVSFGADGAAPLRRRRRSGLVWKLDQPRRVDPAGCFRAGRLFSSKGVIVASASLAIAQHAWHVLGSGGRLNLSAPWPPLL
ncbi:hypothetical protein THAOC_17066 [Thalassiosira oceanica]|uniref:Uncharacterized protein n=1 Tax=Thalassiosira oceanica TaxID=159749 RepID=K0SN06_THAOC|nr:hypothetical protein THAOC_17066 [Thalassiosira oceanica]|eukprot:EJK62326.1 hypothetical protein THAOC_17066 [Thalassiosira oceanica]